MDLMWFWRYLWWFLFVRCLNKSWLLLQTFNCKWATALSILVILVYFSVTHRDARRAGHCFPCSFIREATGAELTFHHSIIGNFMVNITYGSWNEFIAAIHAPTTFRMVFYTLCHYFWGQHCCLTETNILVKNVVFL